MFESRFQLHEKTSFVHRQKRFFQLNPLRWRVVGFNFISEADFIENYGDLCYSEYEEVICLKIHGVKREFSRPFWVRFKKHYCPACMNLLTANKVSKIVNSNSEEAKDYDFSSCDTYMTGNIKFIWTEFLCTACGKTYSLQEIRKNEKKFK